MKTLLAIVLLLLSVQSRALEPESLSGTVRVLMDVNCADAYTGGLGDTESGPPFGAVGANGKCDSNRNIATGTVSTDQRFGPISLSDKSLGVVVLYQGDHQLRGRNVLPRLCRPGRAGQLPGD